jgi:hypothetical protein
MIGLAILTVALLRQVQPHSEPEEQPEPKHTAHSRSSHPQPDITFVD